MSVPASTDEECDARGAAFNGQSLKTLGFGRCTAAWAEEWKYLFSGLPLTGTVWSARRRFESMVESGLAILNDIGRVCTDHFNTSVDAFYSEAVSCLDRPDRALRHFKESMDRHTRKQLRVPQHTAKPREAFHSALRRYGFRGKSKQALQQALQQNGMGYIKSMSNETSKRQTLPNDLNETDGQSRVAENKRSSDDTSQQSTSNDAGFGQHEGQKDRTSGKGKFDPCQT